MKHHFSSDFIRFHQIFFSKKNQSLQFFLFLSKSFHIFCKFGKGTINQNPVCKHKDWSHRTDCTAKLFVPRKKHWPFNNCTLLLDWPFSQRFAINCTAASCMLIFSVLGQWEKYRTKQNLLWLVLVWWVVCVLCSPFLKLKVSNFRPRFFFSKLLVQHLWKRV